MEVHRYLSQSVKIDDFENRISSLLKIIGIDCWSHTTINRVVDVLDVFGSWPDDFIKQYAKEEFYRDDLILRHMMVSDKSIFIDSAFESIKCLPLECRLFERNLEIQNLYRRFGLKNSFSIPVIKDSGRAIFSISARNQGGEEFESNVNENLQFVRPLARIIDYIGEKKFAQQLHGKKAQKTIPIQPRPLELLVALATKDLSLNEAAQVLEISVSTANQQIAAAKKAFGASTTHGAVVAAILGGYILLDM